MPFAVEFSTRAELDLEHARQFLGLRSARAAERLIDGIASTLSLLVDFPELGQRVSGQHRLISIPRTDYRIVYMIGPELIQIVAIAHTSRQPGFWRDRA